MALREYARFVEDAVLCRRIERAKTRVRELSAFINGPRDVSARVKAVSAKPMAHPGWEQAWP